MTENYFNPSCIIMASDCGFIEPNVVHYVASSCLGVRVAAVDKMAHFDARLAGSIDW